MIPLPVLTPWLSSLWLGLVTPLYARVGRELIEGLRNETVVRDERALEVFPLRPRGMRQAIERALNHEDREIALTRWSDAVSSLGKRRAWGGARFGSRIVDSSAVHVPFPPEAAFSPIERIGGKTGWYYANWLWRLRGFFDILAGGVGMRRGRRDPPPRARAAGPCARRVAVDEKCHGREDERHASDVVERLARLEGKFELLEHSLASRRRLPK